jgi:hypothetical protein
MFVKARIFRNLVILFSGIFVFISLALLSAGPLIREIAKAQLRKIFRDSAITVGKCALKPSGSLILSGIEIKNPEAYSFIIEEARARFSLFSLLGGKIPQVDIHAVTARINTPQKNIAEFPRYLRLSSGKSLLVEQINIDSADINVTTRDITLKASASASLNLPDRILYSLDFAIDSFSAFNILVDSARLSVKQKDENGRVSVKEICYNNKLAARDIEGAAALKHDILLLNGLTSSLLGGEISADAKVRLSQELDYLVNAKAGKISLGRIVEDFELKDKFQMSGIIAGEIGLRGKGPNIQFLNVDFSALDPGGTLIITDTKFLELIAKNSQQYLSAVTESFKNYRYDKGAARVFKEGPDYILDVSLEGEQGKRNFKIIANFKSGG